MKNSIELVVFLSLIAGANAQALMWTSCGCHDQGGDFKRACYSTTGCDTCCGYERSNGSHPSKAKGDVTSSAREDHENKTAIMQMQDGPR